ncbi:MAG: hypothetical protein AB7P14_05735 [Blastocatellales bacterium]
MKWEKKTEEMHDVAQTILGYLLEHPDAQDTLEGIVQWWVLERQTKHWIAQVQDALSKLTEEGLILEKKGPDCKTHYRVNRRKLARVRKKLKDHPK